MEEPAGPDDTLRAKREARAQNWGSAWKKKSGALHEAMREARRAKAQDAGQGEAEDGVQQPLAKPKQFFEVGFDGLVTCPTCMKKFDQEEAGEHLAVCAVARATKPKLVKEEFALLLPAGQDLGVECDEPPARMRLRSVDEDGWAFSEGLMRGDEILTLHGKRVVDMSPEELDSLLQDEMIRPLKIKVVRRRRVRPSEEKPKEEPKAEQTEKQAEEEPEDDRIPCPHCGRRFADDATLQRHVNICLKVFAGKKKVDTAKSGAAKSQKVDRTEEDREPKERKKPKRIDCWQTSTRELPPVSPCDEERPLSPKASRASRSTPTGDAERREKTVTLESNRPLRFEIARGPSGGVVVTQVEPGSWGEVQGLKPGDELHRVNGTGVHGLALEDVGDALQERPLELSVSGPERRKSRQSSASGRLSSAGARQGSAGRQDSAGRSRGDEPPSRASRRDDERDTRGGSRTASRKGEKRKEEKPKKFEDGLRGGDDQGIDYKARCGYLEAQLKEADLAKRRELDDSRRQLTVMEKQHQKDLQEERRMRRQLEKQVAQLRSETESRKKQRATGSADAFAQVRHSSSDRHPDQATPRKREPPPDVRRRPPKAGGYAGDPSPADHKARRRQLEGSGPPGDVADLRALIEQERRERLELAQRTQKELLAERRHRTKLEGLLEERERRAPRIR